MRIPPKATLTAVVGLVLTAASGVAGAAELSRGEYLSRIMDCTGCHTPGALAGKPDMARYLGGSDIGFELPGLGFFYPPNLTPHPDAEISKWSEDEIIRAIRTGERPDGRILAPIMPWDSYAALSDEDARALVGFLKTLPPVAHATPAPVGAGEKPPLPYMTVVTPN